MSTTDKLAMAGGKAAVGQDIPVPKWPHTLPADEHAVIEALRKGDLTSLFAGGAVEQLEEAWAPWTQTRHCIGVSNGTAALKLALAALDIGEGDEVIVPALSFVATGFAPVYVGARPVFVDIDPVTFNLNPQHLEDVISPRSKAIIVVHLHGLPANLDAILSIAHRHGLFVIEDAAQAHGALYDGKPVGGLADIGVFSLNASKNLPTCGEGGLMTTNDDHLANRLRMLRQFGERLKRGEKRQYLHEDVGWNNKLGGINAAYTLSQLARFDDDNARRARNIERFLDRLRPLPGLVVPEPSPRTTHVWHILRFRVDADRAQLTNVSNASLKIATQRALNAEGIRVEPYQQRPLPAQPVFAKSSRETMCRLGRSLPTTPYSRDAFPAAAQTIDETFTIQRFHLNPDAGAYLDACADGFEKVFGRHLDFVARMASALTESARAS